MASHEDPLPDFLGIGAQKAGTTWLARSLARHPAIHIPARKEIHYFDRSLAYPTPDLLADDSRLARLLGPRRRHRELRRKLCRSLRRSARRADAASLGWTWRYYVGRCDDAWYASLFRECAGRVVGEITPSYSVLEETDVAHVRRLMPDCRVIFLLRDPVERAWSHIRMAGRKGKRAGSRRLEDLAAFADEPAQRLRSDYLRTIRIWERVFPREQLFYGFFDDIEQRPAALLEQVLGFLGLSTPNELSDEVLAAPANRADPDPMPDAVRRMLSERYLAQLEGLSERFGGHATRWLETARRAAGKSGGEG